MADRNNNGVDDRYENLKPRRSGGNPLSSSAWDTFQRGATYAPTKYNAPGMFGLGEVGNFLIDADRGFTNWWDKYAMGNRDRPEGGALGDFRYGSAPKKEEAYRGAFGRGVSRGLAALEAAAPPPVGDTQLPSFMSFLQQAMEMSGGPERISYDPQRADARRRGAEYDARIAAMYNQLANSMRDDGTGIQKNFQGAIDDTAARSAETQQAIQGASDSADARNMEVLRNLGIEDAQAGIIQGGRDLNTQAAGNVAEAAARGQIAGDALTQNQQAAGAHNANLVGAAGLEGNLQRARVQSELSSLLAQYDMQEQEANRQAQQQSLSQSMGLANALYEDAWRQQGYNDDMTRWLYEQQQAANQPAPVDPGQMGLNFIAQLQQRFPDLAMDDLLKMVQGVGTIGKLYG